MNIVEYILTFNEITKTMFYIFLDTRVYFKQSDTYFIVKYMQKDRYLAAYINVTIYKYSWQLNTKYYAFCSVNQAQISTCNVNTRSSA